MSAISMVLQFKRTWMTVRKCSRGLTLIVCLSRMCSQTQKHGLCDEDKSSEAGKLVFSIIFYGAKLLSYDGGV